MSLALAASASAGTFVQQGPKLKSGPTCIYRLVALSGDGNTALIGDLCTNEEAGAARVFVREGSAWHEQAELHPTDEIGNGHFGEDVGLSYDGNTAIVGGEGDNGRNGAAWVFTRSGSTWTQQGPKFAGLAGERCGVSVGISYDGNTALMACHSADYFFTRTGSTWTQASRFAMLTGFAVALSGDGDTALIAGREQSSATMLVRSGASWVEQQEVQLHSGPFLGPGGGALSANGDTALAGSLVIVRHGSRWSIQQEIASSGAGLNHQGEALSGNGKIALIGTEKPTFFVRAGSTWTQEQALPSRGESEGKFVALSADGQTALIGEAGGAWVYVQEK